MIEGEAESSFAYTSLFSLQKKIRHLKGLSIRNITFEQPCKHPISFKTQTCNTYDDTISRRPENHIKQYNLKDRENDSVLDINISETKQESLSSHELKRHNTKGSLVAYEESLLRLVRLENALKTYLVDTFFTLHIDNIECYSYNDIMKLNTLEKCIWDANNSKKTLTMSLEKYLDKYYKIFEIQKQKNKSSKHLTELEDTIILENKKLKEAEKYKHLLQKSLNARRESMKISYKNQQNVANYLEDAKKTLQYRKATLHQILNKISMHRSRIIAELHNIFPIEPIIGKPFDFTICNLLLPNTNHYKYDQDHVAAGLGYTAHLIYLLSFYLRIPLRYPIRPMCSRAVIEDPINTLHGSKTSFPLWLKGQDHSQFDFGIFLLNKNIEQLMNSQSLIVTNLRHTLPNCKCLLLYIISHLSS
ncbi:hypothetical protein PMAC_000847 [Pneumocystis sp. 'macacae']|nr:hypothetical protein PMAC_000847 [Pneumocystis sp. 'macacae']